MDIASLMGSWEGLRPAVGDAVRDARLQAHWAVQPVAAVARALVPARADDSHTSLTWFPPRRMLVGERVPGRVRVALRLAGLQLCLLDDDDQVVESLLLEGQTLAAAMDWVADRFQARIRLRPRLKPPGYDMPAHPVGDGGEFSVDGEALEALATWYASASGLFTSVRKTTPEALPVRCWPHHFDIATLIALDRVGKAVSREGRTIGVGMSPGDAGYDEPYFYVTPWPYPEGKQLPELPGGAAWHTEGWTGAVLPASRIEAEGGEAGQLLQVAGFVQAAITAARGLL